MKSCHKRKILGFNDTWLMLIGIPLVSLVMPLTFNLTADEFDFWYSRNILITLIHTSFYWIIFRKVFVLLREKFPNFNDSSKRIMIQMATVVILYFLIHPFLDHLCLNFILDGKGKINAMPTQVSTIIMIVLWVAVYEGIYFYQQLKTSIQEKEQLQREHIQSQLEGLKNQVNPHFLFNSLNTLAYLIPEDAEKSVKFVQKLSKVYRYILEIRDKKLISLSEELTFLNSYIFLLKERFEENFQVEIDIPKSRLNDKIVPLSLQILFENAIKHNVISSSKPLIIKVLIGDNNKLVIKNNLQKKKQVRDSTNFGLQNIKNRYRFFSDEAVDVIATSTSFIVSLPLLRMNQ